MPSKRTPSKKPRAKDQAKPDMGVRLHKVMAEAGVASRRDCEDLITQGRVKVNGEVVKKLPAWVDPENDKISVDGEPIRRARKNKRSAAKTYIMVNKPKKVISTNDDPEGRMRVIDLVDLPIAARLYPVGRLDSESTGLILLTNDGDLTHRLTHPSYEVAKCYHVTVQGRLFDEDAEKLRKGMILAHKGKPGGAGAHTRRAAAAEVKILGHENDRRRGDRTKLSITLKEGQNREVRRIVARLGHKVRSLHRIAIGRLKLKGIAVGEWRMLTKTEVRMLYKEAGMKPGEK